MPCNRLNRLSLVPFLFLLFGIFGTARAQLPVKMGFTGGINVSDLHQQYNSDPKTGFAAGVFFQANLPAGFVLQPELYYSQKGAKDKLPGSSQSVTFHYDYIEVPLLLKKSLLSIGPVRPNLFAGPALSFNVKSEATISGNVQDLQDPEKRDWSIIGGLGADIQVRKLHFFINLRYEHGLKDLYPNDSQGQGVYNRAYSLMVGVYL